MDEKIYEVLLEIKKELQTIRSSLELQMFIPEDIDGIRDSGLSNSTGLDSTIPE